MKKTNKIFLVIFTVIIVAMIAVIPAFAYQIDGYASGFSNSTYVYFYSSDEPNQDVYFLDNRVQFSNLTQPVQCTVDTYYDRISYTLSVSETTFYGFILDFSDISVSTDYNLVDSSRHIYQSDGGRITFNINNKAVDSSNLVVYFDTNLTNLQSVYDSLTLSDSVQIGNFIKDSITAGFDIVDDFGAGIKNAFNSVFFKTDPITGSITGVSYLGITSFVFIGIAIITGICMLVFRKLFRRT